MDDNPPPAPTNAAPSDNPRKPVAGLCRGCDYPLRGLEARTCPECGRAFDPNTLSTMNMGLPLGGFGRWALAPAGWPTILLAAIATVPVLWIARLPSPYYLFGWVGLIAALWITALAVWGARTGLRHLIATTRRQFFTPSPVDARRWRLLALFLAFVSLLVLLKVPLRLGFLIARPTLDQLVAEVGNRQPAFAENRRAGPYTIDRRFATRAGQVLVFRLAEDNESAFIHSPGGDPEGAYNPGAHGHLSGPWYWCKED